MHRLPATFSKHLKHQQQSRTSSPKLVLSIHLPKKQLRHFPSAPQLPFRSAPWYEDLQNTSASSPSLDVRGYGKQWYGMVMFVEKFFDALGTFWNTNEKFEKTPVTVFCAFFFSSPYSLSWIHRKSKTQLFLTFQWRGAMMGLPDLEVPFVPFCRFRGGYEILQVERYVVMSRKSFLFSEITEFWLEKNRKSSEEGLHYETMKTWLALNPHLVAHLLGPFSRGNCYPCLICSLLSTAQTRVVSILIKHQNSINFPHLSTLGSLDYQGRILLGDHSEFRHMAGKS